MGEREGSVRLTISDIETKQFHFVAKGYDPREVDEFLDSICDEMELMQAETESLNSKVELAKAETRKAEAASGFVTPAMAAVAPDASFREILEMAQRVKEQTISDAQTKAEEILANAQAKAEAELGSLEEERDRLEKAVEELREKAQSYRDALAEMVRKQQEALDQFEI